MEELIEKYEQKIASLEKGFHQSWKEIVNATRVKATIDTYKVVVKDLEEQLRKESPFTLTKRRPQNFVKEYGSVKRS